MKKRNHFTLFLLIALSIIIQIYSICPPVLSDQLQYYGFAASFPQYPVTPSHWSLRFGLIFPVALIYRIFGYSEISYYFIPTLGLILLTLVIFKLGEKLFSYRIGIISALWFMTMPGILKESGNLLPDIPATLCIAGGFFVLLNIISTNDLKEQPKERDISNFRLFSMFAGILFGWAYLTKEYFLIFLLLVPIFFFTFSIPWKYLINFFLGFFLIISVELLLGTIFYRDPFIRLLTAQPRETWGEIERNVKVILTNLPILMVEEGNFLSLSLMIFFTSGSLIRIHQRNCKYLFLFSWALLVFGFFTGLGLLPIVLNWGNEVVLRTHIFRYWIPILPPIIIGGIAIIDSSISSIIQKLNFTIQTKKIINNVFLAGLLLISITTGFIKTKNYPEFVRNGNDHYLELRKFLSKLEKPLYSIWILRDIRVAYDDMLPIYTHDFWGKEIWKGKIKYLNDDHNYMHLEEIPVGYILIDREYYNLRYNRIPDYLDSLPENWQLAFESENRKIALYLTKK